MKQRWLVVAVGIPFMIVAMMFCPDWVTMLLVSAVGGIAAYELLHAIGRDVGRDVYGVTIAAAILQGISIYLAFIREEYGRISAGQLLFIPWLLLMGLFLLAVIRYGKRTLPFSALCAAFFGGAVIPTMLSCIFLLRSTPEYGRVYVLFPFCIAFLGDAFSMYGGMLFGGKKLAPNVSPKKTWAGALAGPVGSAVAMLICGVVVRYAFSYTPHYLRLALVGVIGNIIGQLGDLSFSLIKREAGVKDYSQLFLTHGGVLDRFDSALFISPIVYALVVIGWL